MMMVGRLVRGRRKGLTVLKEVAVRKRAPRTPLLCSEDEI